VKDVNHKKTKDIFKLSERLTTEQLDALKTIKPGHNPRGIQKRPQKPVGTAQI